MRSFLKFHVKYQVVTFLVSAFASAAQADVQRRVFTDSAKNQVIKIEWLSDGLIHFEFTNGVQRKSKDPIYASPLIKPQNFSGPTTFTSENGNVFITAETRVSYAGGCILVTDSAAKKQIAKICAADTGQPWKRLELDTSGVRNVYGLGQMFGEPGDMTTDRNGKVTATKGAFGNGMPSYAGGATGETMFPVVMALGTGQDAWGFVLDNIYKQSWDLTRSKWSIGMFGDQIRGFVIAGSSPREVRQRFMGLAGRAPVPPRKMFGFWMSEYGYDNWDEVSSRLSGMRRDGFPIDGFFLDLQWFGNVAPGSDHTRMGSLTFDERNFPAPESTIQSLLKNEDVGLVTIEESYVGRALPEHDDLEAKGFLAHECGRPTTASYLTGDVTGNSSEWWGRGGMIDWSNPEAGRYWHNSKRQTLIRMGIFAHWLDLGEPEMFDPSSCYHGAGEPGLLHHQDVHNLFSLFWAKSLWDGFAENHVTRRPFSMLRSGNIGLQRFGAGMWSGDIGGNLPSLAAHIASHSQMSWSGIDYYSSDIGGFHRNRSDGKPLSFMETQENFTQWFANATWFDVPVRSHVMNLDNNRDTAPNKIGHVESNRVNLLTRYSLTPYYYSLAHRAARTGLPLMEPMAMRFPEDLMVRRMGEERMVGDLLVVAAAEQGAYKQDVYLPSGLWYDFGDGSHTHSAGEQLEGYPLYRDGLFRLPVFIRAGALIPRYAGSMNQRGLGASNINRVAKAMLLDVYADTSPARSQFEFTEDDGESRDFENGKVRVTALEQQTVNLVTTVTVGGAVGSFVGAEAERSWTVRVWSPGWSLKSVDVNGTLVSVCPGRMNLMTDPCYKVLDASAVIVEMPAHDVQLTQRIRVNWVIGGESQAAVHFVCDEGRDAPRGHGMYVVGDHPSLGSWDPDRAIALRSAEFARGVWSKVIKGLPAGSQIEWKCIRKLPGRATSGVEWQSGANNRHQINSRGGFSGLALARW